MEGNALMGLPSEGHTPCAQLSLEEKNNREQYNELFITYENLCFVTLGFFQVIISVDFQ